MAEVQALAEFVVAVVLPACAWAADAHPGDDLHREDAHAADDHGPVDGHSPGGNRKGCRNNRHRRNTHCPSSYRHHPHNRPTATLPSRAISPSSRVSSLCCPSCRAERILGRPLLNHHHRAIRAGNQGQRLALGVTNIDLATQ